MCRIDTEVYDCKKHIHGVVHRPCKMRNDQDHPCRSLQAVTSTKGNCPQCSTSKAALMSRMEQEEAKVASGLQVRMREEPNGFRARPQLSLQVHFPDRNTLQSSKPAGALPVREMERPSEGAQSLKCPAKNRLSSLDDTTSAVEPDLAKLRLVICEALQAANKEADEKLVEYLTAAKTEWDEGVTDEGLDEYLKAASAAEKIREEFERLNKDFGSEYGAGCHKVGGSRE